MLLFVVVLVGLLGLGLAFCVVVVVVGPFVKCDGVSWAPFVIVSSVLAMADVVVLFF